LLALQLLGRVVFGGQSLSDLLPEGQARLSSPADRALLQELCYGCLRWHYRLHGLTGAMLQRPLKSRDRDLGLLIQLGLYQLLYTRIPPHAAVAETVALARRLDKPWAVGLVNAVLRRFQRERSGLLAAADRDPVLRYASPPWLLEALQAAWPERWGAILDACNQRPPMTLRVNLAQGSRDAYRERLSEAGLGARALEAVPSALVLERPVDVDRLPGFADGAVSVQDAGAQLAAGLLDLAPGQRVLDACAAPGGKTGHLLEAEPGLTELVAVDLDPQRLQRVHENLRRLRLQARVCQGDAGAPAGDWAAAPFQRILLDVPCSATGVIRRHPDIRLLRRKADLAALARDQAQMLDAVWPLLAPGGILLYATCSLMPEENERQLLAFLQRRPEARERPLAAAWGHARAVGRQTLPGEADMDGFYYACLEKI
jgi:16S rRNA (cytosine967-C5)-methyltransferase